MFPIISKVSPSILPSLASFLTGVFLGWYILSGVSASKELAEKNAELMLIKNRLKAVIEVSLRYREETLLIEKEYETFKDQNAKDLPSTPDSLPHRRVLRLNQIR
jgi:hypothetical protein